jgi:alanyl-tRNA synthetase
MAATTRLYLDDPLLLGFDASVATLATWHGRPSVVLDRTAFYPEAGGQSADRGTLHGAPVSDVQVDGDGVIHHLLEGPAPSPGDVVRGEVDRAHRRLNMSLHTGQHVLSAALAREARAPTVSSRLGETMCTIDVDRDPLPERDLARAEDLANGVLEDDLPVRAFFPPPEELARLPLRRQPQVDKDVRVVAVGDFDFSPCGGTHCTRTAQVGLVKVVGVERYKGKTRVSFLAGRLAREELARRSDALAAVGLALTCGPLEVPGAVDKLRRDATETLEALKGARVQLAQGTAEGLLARALGSGRGIPRVVAVLSDGGVEVMRAVAKRLGPHPGVEVFLATPTSDGQGLSVLVTRGPGAALDCGAFLKRAALACGGKGGGGPERAEGRVPPGTDWAALVTAHAGP